MKACFEVRFMFRENISINQVHYLAEEIEYGFNSVTIRRGFDYYKEGKVHDIKNHNNHIEAMVKGNESYFVNLNLNNFKLSNCSCPVRRNCKHMAALFFSLYSIYDMPDNFIKRYRNPLNRITSDGLGSTNYEKTTSTLPSYSSTIEQWYIYFEEEYKPLKSANNYNVYMNLFVNFLDSLKRIAVHWPSPFKDFYYFHGCLFTMEKMDQFYKEAGFYYYITSSTFQNTCQNLISQLLEASIVLKYLSNKTEGSKVYFQTTLDKLREKLLLTNHDCFDWLRIYKLLWSKSFNFQDLINKELQCIDALLKAKNLTLVERNYFILAQTHFEIMAGEDEKAFQNMDKIDIKIKNVLFDLNNFYTQQQWERLRNWLRWLIPKMDNATYEDYKVVSSYWLDMANHSQDFVETLEVLSHWLPQSGDVYVKCLFAAKMYKSWVNYQVFTQNSPFNISKNELKAIESEDPSLLLPLYHQFAIRYIQEKNRIAYKSAVRMLKKLKTYYKKLKRPEEWERYINGLSTQYSRLRALQEEMRKGKIIDD